MNASGNVHGEFVKIPAATLMALKSTNAADEQANNDEMKGEAAEIGVAAIILAVGGFFIFLLIPRIARRRFSKVDTLRRRERSPLMSRPISPAAESPHHESVDDGATTKSNKRTVSVRGKSRIKDYLDAGQDFSLPQNQTTPNIDTRIHFGTGNRSSHQISSPLDHDKMLTLAPSLDECSSLRSSPSPRLFFGRQSLYDPSPNNRSHGSSQTGSSPQSVMLGFDGTKTLLVLMAERCSDKTQALRQSDAFSLLRARRVPFQVVDPAQRDLRIEMERLSGRRGIYPQFFFLHGDDSLTYVGDWTAIQRIHQAEGLPKSYLQANPEISTWEDVFGDSSHIFSV